MLIKIIREVGFGFAQTFAGQRNGTGQRMTDFPGGVETECAGDFRFAIDLQFNFIARLQDVGIIR